MVQLEAVVVVNDSHLQVGHHMHITASHAGSGAFGETCATTSTATGTKSGEACSLGKSIGRCANKQLSQN